MFLMKDIKKLVALAATVCISLSASGVEATGPDYITTDSLAELTSWCASNGCCQKDNGATGHCSINAGATVTIYANACR